MQLIDLDAAMGSGTNDALVRHIAPQLPCRVGGGIRTLDRARAVLDYGATAVIVGSSLFRDGRPDLAFAAALAAAVGPERIIAAVDSKGGRVVVKGWTEAAALSAVEAVRQLEPFCEEFLYTHVDREGLMQGTDLDAIMAVRRATSRRLTAAGRHHHAGRDRHARRGGDRRRRGHGHLHGAAADPERFRRLNDRTTDR